MKHKAERNAAIMMRKLTKKLVMPVFAMVLMFGAFGMNANAAQTSDLTFEIAIFTYDVVTDATQEDMPVGFTIGDWEYNGVPVKAGFTENSNMVCVMGQDQETGYKYRFIYDPESELFVPYFGMEIKDGYIYTIPIAEDAEVPYGFVESYFVIQTVPMFTYMRSDAELTQEEIAVGSLSEDNYLVFLMMDQNGKEEHYTYDLIDRTFQRSLLQKKDAEKVTELNEVIDELHTEISVLNANHADRMNSRLTLIGILIAAVVIMLGIIVNLILKVMKLKDDNMLEVYDDDEELEDLEDFEAKVIKEAEKEIRIRQSEPVEMTKPEENDDELEILDLDLED